MRALNINSTLYGNFSAASFTAWANSPDLYRFKFNSDTQTPLNLTGKSVGVYLLAGANRATAVCRRPTSTQVAPDTAGVSVVSPADGRIDFKFLPEDISVTDNALWLEFWMDVFPSGFTATATSGGGTVPSGEYTYLVTAVTPDGETLGEEEVVTLDSTGNVSLSWSAVDGATAYRVYRKSGIGSYGYVQIAPATIFTDTGSETFSVVGEPPSVSSTKYMLGQYRVSVAIN